ncbi:MAG: prolipoprotein diacylglyceryl transferase [Cytophagales bacterium]|nr:prolipoprotein diacylglyceryl transferase [Cytophagales bacterium]MDW8384333.1 prolipoprotein diacylglyceryl transferase [Flammeovirgaceae bacterium]
MKLLGIIWDVSPEIFSIGNFAIRWYGLLFALGFLVGQNMMMRFYKWEGKNEKDVEVLTLYMVIATVVGARLGHCLFYQPDIYLADPIQILYIWEGGLASHGAAIGIMIAIWLYTKKFPDQPYLWLFDRLVIPVALGGCFIRIGNLMNSEIVGKPTDLPWGFIFVRNQENFPRHPAQLYEAIFYFFTFLFLRAYYIKYKEKTPQGKIFGMFFVLVFGFRFLVEFLKKEQVDFEQSMLLNMGQLLSLPFIGLGIWLLRRAKKSVQSS